MASILVLVEDLDGQLTRGRCKRAETAKVLNLFRQTRRLSICVLVRRCASVSYHLPSQGAASCFLLWPNVIPRSAVVDVLNFGGSIPTMSTALIIAEGNVGVLREWCWRGESLVCGSGHAERDFWEVIVHDFTEL